MHEFIPLVTSILVELLLHEKCTFHQSSSETFQNHLSRRKCNDVREINMMYIQLLQSQLGYTNAHHALLYYTLQILS